MIIQIEVRSVYGEEKAYPLCEDAVRFARIAGTVTLTRKTLRLVAELGYRIHVLRSGSIPCYWTGADVERQAAIR
jgi:hypothetical protein